MKHRQKEELCIVLSSREKGFNHLLFNLSQWIAGSDVFTFYTVSWSCNAFFQVEYHEIFQEICVFLGMHISLVRTSVLIKKRQEAKGICLHIPLE